MAYCLSGNSDHLFDPAVGTGAFFRAAKRIMAEKARAVQLFGMEIDGAVLEQATRNGLTDEDVRLVEIRDFLLQPPKRCFAAIVANPPYIRHHRLSLPLKAELQRFAKTLVGARLDARAGLHVYFFLRALELLERNGHLAFIVPADICEGVFAGPLWRWISGKYRLEAVVTFAPEASPFPDVDTNPVILMLTNARPCESFYWAKCLRRTTWDLKAWVCSGFRDSPRNEITVVKRELSEGVTTGLSREPPKRERSRVQLGDFATVLRGIATGSNEFFFLTERQAVELRIPPDFLIPAIGRTRDVDSDEVTVETISKLVTAGRPTLLFAPGGMPLDSFPQAVINYIKKGEGLGLPRQPLIATRRPWYKMETRDVPPFLFAYLGRRNARFIRNLAGVVPLTGFLCVYPRKRDPLFIEKLWQVLRHPETVANLSLVGKSYGAGAIKVEPRALEQLPLSPSFLSEIGLQAPQRQQQLTLPALP